jgi:hypothetical protein
MITNLNEIINKVFTKNLNEATGDSSGSRGSYIAPIMPGFRKFKKSQLAPFNTPVSKYDDSELAYDSYDGTMETPKSKIKKLEKEAEKITNYVSKHFTPNDDDGDIINNNPIFKNKNKNISKPFVSEADTSITAGIYNAPLEIGLKKWRKQELGPFTEFSTHPVNKIKKQKTLKNNIKRNVGVWEKHPETGYDIPKHEAHTINEDLGVWFGTKKKPKGSKQPKGPWVNICKKVDGKHPPCGRPDASDKAYPKCRAAGVAGKMSDSQKKSACQQKRRAEKSNPKTGTGNKPKMVSYKPKKKKTNEEILIDRLIKKII